METRSAKDIWEAALEELRIQISKPNYRTWLEPTVGISYEGDQFVVGVPNTFAAEYLETNLRSLLEKTLIGLLKHDSKVIFRVETPYKNQLDDCGVWGGTRPVSLPQLNPKYTFDSFVVGSSNQLAYAASMAVAKNPGHTYNPLLIYGGAGLGKTHLLCAIGHAALAANMQVLLVSAEQFTNEFIKAIRAKKMEDFRNKYRRAEMLLVDDIQFIGGKEQTEECFFHTFNELHNSNHQIAITSDRPPKSMPILEDRLRSRFEWGLVADIQPPDIETRLAILQAKAEHEGMNITTDVLEFIAQRVHQNIRELEGLLNRLLAYARMIRASPTLELAARALEDRADKEPERAAITPSQVIEAVASSFQLKPDDLKSRNRDKETVLARQVAMYLMKEANIRPLARIGNELGGRDHHAVTGACKKIASDMATNHDLKARISNIQQIISPAFH